VSDWNEDRDREIQKLIDTQDISEVITHAVESMICGAIDGLMVNLGHPVSCDPGQTTDYGQRLLCRAIDELRSKGGGR
jgi:hypothetical protein